MEVIEDAKKATALFKSLDTSEATLTIQRECAAQIAEIYLHGTRQLDNHQLDTINMNRILKKTMSNLYSVITTCRYLIHS